MGTPESLKISDYQCIIRAIEQQDQNEAVAYVRYFHELNLSMIFSGVEWVIRWPSCVAKQKGSEEEIATRKEAYELLKKSLRDAPAETTDPNKFLLEYLGSEKFNGNTLSEFSKELAGGQPTLLKNLNEKRVGLFEKALLLLGQNEFCSARESIDLLFTLARSDHDLLLRYVWAFATITKLRFGEHFASAALAMTLQTSLSYQAGMELVKQITPRDLAIILAEHLRGHFSGTNREGQVEIIEEVDRYRLVLEPCGSGGAMRRAGLLNVMGKFDIPVADTWGQQNVPIYCAHCAQNEIRTAQILGYPAWITNFNSDSNKPCGWTVYKNPKDIPNEVLHRLGGS
jgi:hypothetical protein